MKTSTQETPASPETPTVIFILAGYSTVVTPEIPVLEMVIEIIQVKREHILVLIKFPLNVENLRVEISWD